MEYTKIRNSQNKKYDGTYFKHNKQFNKNLKDAVYLQTLLIKISSQNTLTTLHYNNIHILQFLVSSLSYWSKYKM